MVNIEPVASPATEAESAILRARYPDIAAAYEPTPAEACTELGAEDPEDIRHGMQALAGALLGFVAFVAVVGFAIVCTRVLA